ncbi:MAG: ATP-dependent DNA helicase RecG [Bacteroidetes bacterium]|nr:ATP-dependent DNA helicase RecG [Bacteroidota bacterium]
MSLDFLQDSVQFLKGVGPHRSHALAQSGILSVHDLLSYYPRRYLDRTSVTRIADVRAGSDPVTVIGTVVQTNVIPGRRTRRFEITLEDEPGRRIKCVWFQGVAWVSKSMELGHRLAVHGKPTKFGASVSFSHPEFDRLDEEGTTLDTGRIIALYPGTALLEQSGFTSRSFRKIIYSLIKERGTELKETLPQSVVQRLGLMDGRIARRAIHFPKSQSELDQAKNRLKFEELFFFQLMLASKRVDQTKIPGVVMPSGGALERRFLGDVLPFQLTGDQRKSLADIRSDLVSGVQMNRLLQGDVGSGKTVVAAISALIAIDSGFQVAFMAPTEILAEQHARSLSALFDPLGIQWALLTGSTSAADRKRLHEGLQSGMIKLIVGTHAIIQDKVEFQRLGLSIIDEQHRFGVLQRAELTEKGEQPHVLLMTATPIPRSLALTLYGDIDVSIIRELPPGRQPIKTKMVREKERDWVYARMQEVIDNGGQCYVVYPLVEESEKLDLKDAVSGHELISAQFPGVQVELVHGRMKSSEKEAVMARFISGQSSILVSTTVIEVGVDVPNATFMMIEHAERFGLSQLHQLRGRIGRGSKASTCILMAEFRQTEESRKRLRAMELTTDGFKISEFDMELRGIGDFFGTRQSGLPTFRIANLITDFTILDQARAAAFKLTEVDPGLTSPEHAEMKSYFQLFFERKGLRLSRIG